MVWHCYSINGSVNKNVMIYGVNMSSSVHIDKKEKYILILGEGPIEGLDNTKMNSKSLIFN